MTPRALARDALLRIDDGAYANLVLRGMLERSGLDERDRAFVTDLVYGTTRMRRACDFLVDRFLLSPPDQRGRAVLRLGAYQLAFLGTPAHAAVSETVEVAPRHLRGMVNAVLRRLADDLAGRGVGGVPWPDAGTRLSYPDWVVDRLSADLGEADALAALEAMNARAEPAVRPDGYVQDRASQWVASLVDAGPGDRVADVCAAPGGKATAIARAGAWVVAGDVSAGRAGLVTENAGRLGLPAVCVVVADGRASPLRRGAFSRVLVDAPCTGLGVLRRRPDARWRVGEGDVPRLAALQRELLSAACTLLEPGGILVYSVCTMTREETEGVAAHAAAAHPQLEALPAAGPPWREWGTGALLLPQDRGTDGMALYRWRLHGDTPDRPL